MTWAAGHVTNSYEFMFEFQPYWFCVPYAVMTNDHLPEFETRMSVKDYELQQWRTLDFFLLGLKCTQYNSSVINSPSHLQIHFIGHMKDLTISCSDAEKPNNLVYTGAREANTPNYFMDIFLPEDRKTQHLNFFANNKLIIKYQVNLKNRVEPSKQAFSYTPEFDGCVSLVSHRSAFIQSDASPVVLLFETPSEAYDLHLSFQENIANWYQLLLHQKWQVIMLSPSLIISTKFLIIFILI